jgi:hypothetical protein
MYLSEQIVTYPVSRTSRSRSRLKHCCRNKKSEIIGHHVEQAMKYCSQLRKIWYKENNREIQQHN